MIIFKVGLGLCTHHGNNPHHTPHTTPHHLAFTHTPLPPAFVRLVPKLVLGFSPQLRLGTDRPTEQPPPATFLTTCNYVVYVLQVAPAACLLSSPTPRLWRKSQVRPLHQRNPARPSAIATRRGTTRYSSVGAEIFRRRRTSGESRGVPPEALTRRGMPKKPTNGGKGRNRERACLRRGRTYDVSYPSGKRHVRRKRAHRCSVQEARPFHAMPTRLLRCARGLGLLA